MFQQLGVERFEIIGWISQDYNYTNGVAELLQALPHHCELSRAPIQVLEVLTRQQD
jgi:hypothetical protein